MDFCHKSYLIAAVAAAVFFTNKNDTFIFLSPEIVLFYGFIYPFFLCFLKPIIHTVWDTDTLQDVTNVYGGSLFNLRDILTRSISIPEVEIEKLTVPSKGLQYSR